MFIIFGCKNEVSTCIGFGRIPHDEEIGVDIEQLNKNQQSIIIGLCLIFLSPLAMIVLICIHLRTYWCTFIFFVLRFKPD